MPSFVEVREDYWINFDKVSSVEFTDSEVTICYTWNGVAGATTYPVHWEVLTIGEDKGITPKAVEALKRWFIRGK